jgi:sugar O-acyltransferase (sialic acid O-acetyltransferase NeuD family)
MEDLILLGVGVHPGEIVEIVDRVNAEKLRWNLLGYLSAKRQEVGTEFCGKPVLGTYEDTPKFPRVKFLPVQVPKQGIFAKSLGLPLERFATIIDPSCFVSRTAKIGHGCTIYPHCFIGLNAHVGDFVFSLSGSIINHDDVIEDGVCICSGVNLSGYVHVEPDCYLGAGSMVRQQLRVGAGAYLGMGAVVVKDVPPNTVVVGNPARKLREV